LEQAAQAVADATGAAKFSATGAEAKRRAETVFQGMGVCVGCGVDEDLPGFSLVSSVTRKVFAWSNRRYMYGKSIV
jgi:hypothetical protein